MNIFSIIYPWLENGTVLEYLKSRSSAGENVDRLLLVSIFTFTTDLDVL